MSHRFISAGICLSLAVVIWCPRVAGGAGQGPLKTFLARFKDVKPPTEGADWKVFKEAKEKFSVLLPAAFRLRTAPDEETDTVLYCIAGGSLKDYRLFRAVVSKRAVPEAEENLGSFAKEYVDQEAAKRLRNPVLIEKAIVTVGQSNAFLIVLEADSPGGFHVTQAILILRLGEERCELHLSCLQSNFEQNADAFAQVLLSIKMKAGL